MPRAVRLVTLGLALMLVLGVTAVLRPATATADPEAATLVVAATLAPDAALTVSETLTWGGSAPATVVQKLALRSDAGADSDYRYDITQVSAVSGDTDLGATTKVEGDHLVITVPTAASAGQPITIKYTARGAVAASPASGSTTSMFSWPILQGLSVGVKEVSGEVKIPGVITGVDCKSGPAQAPTPCRLWAGGTHDAQDPSFEDGPRAPGDVVVLSFGVADGKVRPDAVLERRWSLDHAFSLTRTSILLTVLTLLLGGLGVYTLHRRAGRDIQAIGEPLRVAEFAPVGPGVSEFRLLVDIRPGQIGTVADERVDPVDVTATLLDLAVRGFVRIHELPAEPHMPMDWRFERLEGGRGALHSYEELLLDTVAPREGTTVLVSQMAGPVGAVIGQVQDFLYRDVVTQGWFDKRPDATRNTWAVAGWVGLGVALAATVLLAIFTNLALWGLALVVVALAVILVSPEMPRRSDQGSRLLAGLHVLSVQLQHQPTDQMPPERVYAELSEVLPYAVVLGGVQRWLQAIADADDDPDPDTEDLGWYHATGDWQLANLPASVDAFIITVEGRLFGR